jgi:hypothetical protein
MATNTPNPNPNEMETNPNPNEMETNTPNPNPNPNEDILSWKMVIFIVANCYFVLQGVILTIVGHGAQNLKPSSSWFLFTLSILAVLINLFAFIQIAIKYIDAKISQEEQLKKEISKRHDHYLYSTIFVAIYIIIFLNH